MPKKTCCCPVNPNDPEAAFCCNPIFYKDFITLYGDTMAEHAEVSPKDWIALYVSRPPATGSNTFFCSSLISTSAPYTCRCTDVFDSSKCVAGECPGPECYYDNVFPYEGDDGKYACCQSFYLTTTSVGSGPIFFAYKYSGCHLLWFPREFAFNYDPYVVQCNGFLTRRRMETSTGQVYFRGVQNSCCPWATQEPVGAGAGAAIPPECTIISVDGEIPFLNYMPCACSTHPHIHGGIYDALNNRVNVKLSPYSLGYIPFMLPFSQPMLDDEVGCCWCSLVTGNGMPFDAYKKLKRGCFMNSYPKSDGSGRTINTNNVCGPGIDCNNQQTDVIGLNPGYKTECFNRGISPYLLRISQEDHKLAHTIWGFSEPNKNIDFGVSYEIKEIEIIGLSKNIKLKYKKYTGRKNKLKDQFIGTVHLEHHFEMYAYRSNVGSAVLEIQALQNNCNSLISPYESYGGIITRRGSNYRWNPWKYDSILWQVRRAVPRRVMYRGSGIPLFQFDLVNMETKSYELNIRYLDNYFDGATFMEHYFRYFYGLIYFNTGKCEGPGDVPNAPEWDFSHYLNSYDYVRYWLEQMILTGILRIKDHAIDIADEVNSLIEIGSRDPITGDVQIPETKLLEVGGTTGYINLLNFFNVEPGTVNAITPKIIKDKLFQGGSLFTGPSNDKESFRAFLPRRALLPLSEALNGITAWGVTRPAITLPGTTFGITGAPQTIREAIRVPTFFDREDVLNIINPQSVVCGLMAAFVIDLSGKIFPFGSDDLEESGGDCSDPFNNWPPRVGCFPTYLNILTIMKVDPDNNSQLTFQLPEEIPDARVIDLAYKKDFVVVQLDTIQGALSQNCFNQEFPTTDLFTPAYENSVQDIELEYRGVGANVNGNNEYRTTMGFQCMAEDPFTNNNIGLGVKNGARAYETRKPNAYRLKSWGTNAKKYGTFCGSNIQAGESVQENQEQGIECSQEPIHTLRWDPEVNPLVDGGKYARMYPGTNTWFIWKSISSGIKHFAAIDDMNGIFITPQSDNTFNQSQKGKGVTYYSGWIQALAREAAGEENVYPGSFFCTGHRYVGAGFNYFPHIPRPGYIKEDEWSQSFYNNITLRFSSYKKYNVECPPEFTVCGESIPPGNPNNPPPPCAEAIFRIDPNGPNGCCTAVSYIKDKTALLLGSLVEWDYADVNSTTGLYFAPENDTQPKYTKVACGTYNTLLLTNENKLEIYGSYVKITPQGDPVVNNDNPIIPTFIPSELSVLKGNWTVEYACNKIYCAGATHSPILNYEYNPPEEQNIITQIYSSSDYSICVTDNKTIHIWGDKSMVPGLFNPLTYRPGEVGYKVLTELSNVSEIVSIAAGINSIYIHYKKNLVNNSSSIPVIASVTYEYTRYNINGTQTEVPNEVQNSRVTDIDAGYLHAVALYNKKLDSRAWDYEDFNTLGKKGQFKNFNTLPFYFRRQAFFHALPGTWDYSKWLYGSICCKKLESPGGGDLETGSGNPVSRQDPCSILSYNIFNGERDLNLSYSGNPQLFWMRSDWRRATFQATDLVASEERDPTDPQKCRPDVGIQVDERGANFSYMSGAIGDCLDQYGPCWGSARPLVSSRRRDRIRTLPSCWGIPCTNVRTFVNPYPNRAGPFACLGVSPNPQIGYRTTRDIFQKMTHFYGNVSEMDSAETAFSVCPGYKGSAYSYFKYAERHYYFGYDRNKDTWEIYDNPDFLRETSNKFPILIDNPEVNYDISNIGTGWTYGCRNSGFGGGQGPDGGLSAGCCDLFLYRGCTGDWSILKDYPLTGPNYSLENVVETPVVIASPLVQRVVVLAQGPVEGNPNPETICNQCFTEDFPLANIREYLGPGGFMMNPGSPGILSNDSAPRSPMLYQHLYNQYIYRTLYPSELLKGVKTNLRTINIPPNQLNTDYAKTSFIDVLKDPSQTNQFNPWQYPSSTKWNPICWRSPTLLPSGNEDTLIEKDLYFNYSINQNIEGSYKQISIQPTTTPPEPPQIVEVEYDLYQLPIVEGPGSLDPQDDNYDPNSQNNIRLMEKFISNEDYPRSIIIQKGLFEFFIQVKPRWGTGNPIFFFVKLFKSDITGNETLLLESDQYSSVANPGGNWDTVEDGSPSGPQPLKYEELRFNIFSNENIQLDETDRLVVKFYIKGGDMNEDPNVGESIFIKYEDSSFVFWIDPDDPNAPPVNTGISNYTRMKYSFVQDSGNQICFGGFSNDDIIPAYATQNDPNIVLLIYDDENRPVVLGPAMICALSICCGE